MKYNFEIKEISRFDSTELIQTYHYSKIMPRLTKHFLGCFLGDEMVVVPSTSKLNSKDFEDYLSKVEVFASILK